MSACCLRWPSCEHEDETKRPLFYRRGHDKDCHGEQFPSQPRCTCGYIDYLRKRSRADTSTEPKP